MIICHVKVVLLVLILEIVSLAFAQMVGMDFVVRITSMTALLNLATTEVVALMESIGECVNVLLDLQVQIVELISMNVPLHHVPLELHVLTALQILNVYVHQEELEEDVNMCKVQGHLKFLFPANGVEKFVHMDLYGAINAIPVIVMRDLHLVVLYGVVQRTA